MAKIDENADASSPAARKLACLIERVESVMLTMEGHHPWKVWLAASVKEAREP